LRLEAIYFSVMDVPLPRKEHGEVKAVGEYSQYSMIASEGYLRGMFDLPWLLLARKQASGFPPNTKP
jgi:hypothetical protein